MSDNNKKDLLSRWLNRSKDSKNENSARSNAINPMPQDVPRRLSYGQKRLWLLQQLYPENAFYNYAEIYKVSGEIDVPVFESSIAQVINRHEILRTTFEDSEEGLVQVLNQSDSFHFTFKSHSDYDSEDKDQIINDFAQKNGGKPFDLVKGPLVRIGLLHLGDNAYVLVVNMHHIITDKWSMRIFREELAEIYNASVKGISIAMEAPKLQYADFAHWEQNKEIDKKQLDYWMKRLAGAPEILNLPTDYKRPKIPSHKGAFCKRKIDKRVSDQVDALCKKNNTTHFVFYLSVFTIMLQRYCRQDDLLLGTPISNRSQSSLERMIGFFNETIVLRFNLDAQHSFTEYLQLTRKNVLDAFSNKDIPLELLIKELGVSRDVNINPLFQAMFLYHKVPEKPVWEGFDIAYETLDAGVSKFDLTMYVAEDEDGFSATIEYATDLFDERTILRMQECYAFLLDQITEKPDVLLSSLELATALEKKEIYTLLENDRSYPSDEGIHSLIISQLEKNGGSRAVSSGDDFWTYDDLIQNAKKIAIRLGDLGVSKGDVVAVCTDRSVEMVGAIVGVLMAGAVYMPLDPNYPLDRIRYMLQEAKCKFVLCDEKQEDLFSSIQSENLYYRSIMERSDSVDKELNIDISSDDIAYLIFTSGSSGKPKGVSVSHGNIIHSTVARDDFYPSIPESFLLLSSFAFDSSMVGLFWTLCRGGNLVLTPEKIEQDMDSLSKMIAKHEVSHTLMLPSLYQILLDQSEAQNLRSLKCVIVAGEACHSKMCADHFRKLPDAKLYNEYGPTEASVWCTGYEITVDDLNTVIPIGPSISSTDIFVLDDYGNMLPRGIPGEIYIGGRGITKGYINREDLTAEKFVEHNFEQQYPSLLYRSGDLGMMRQDGVLEFLGRVDHQIKIRGFRVELTEIQNALQSISDFEEVVVVAIKNEEDGVSNKVKSIIAFYVSDEEIDSQKVKNHLNSLLPEYMIPSHFVKMEALPKLPNGKYDYKHLERMDLSDEFKEGQSYQGPRNDVERSFVSIWEEVLSINRIGIYDNFFALGGDSILSIQINGKALNMGLKFPANEIFKSQTIAELAQHVELKLDSIEEEMYVGEVSLLPIQRWYLENFKINPGHWHLGVRFELTEGLNTTALSDVIKVLVERHETLRFKFNSDNSKVAQAANFSNSYFEVYNDCKASSSDQENFIQATIQSICSTARLEEGKLFKCLYFNNGDLGGDTLILVAHHLVVDQVSWYIIIDELSKALEQRLDGKRINLGAKSIPYHRWSQKLVDYIGSPVYKLDQKYWTSQFASLGRAFDKEHPTYLEGDVTRTKHRLDASTTEKITRELTQTFDAKVSEILMSALVKAMHNWKGYTSIILETEGHGREPLDDQTTFHNSVGWFTSIYPIFLEIDADRDSHAELQYIKNKVRSVPSKGLTFGVCKYLVEDKNEKSNFDYKADVLFNYIGKVAALESDLLGKPKMLEQGMRSNDSERVHPLEFNIYIDGGELVMYCSYVNSYTSASGFQDLLLRFENELQNLSNQTEVNRSHNYVPADFQDADLDEEDLDALFEQF